MRQFSYAFILLVGSILSASAGPSIGIVPQTSPVIKIACDRDDVRSPGCSLGLYYACSRRGCQCYACGGSPQFNDGYYGQRGYRYDYDYAPQPRYYSPRPRYYNYY